MTLTLFATHPLGFSDLIEQELLGWGAQITSRSIAGVGFSGSLECAYRACLWSRVANRILLQIDSFDAPDPDALYGGTQRTRWLDHIDPQYSIAVDFTTSHSQINHSLYGAQRVKDAIVDQIRDATGARPNVDVRAADVRINVHLERDRATLSIDLSGDSLHRRGYRRAQGLAPLKENLAAALLLRAGWPKIAAGGGALLDPMCGSGTFAIEALMMAADIAPGLSRAAWGFEKWAGHQHEVWAALIEEARARRYTGLQRAPIVQASDHDPHAVASATENIACIGLAEYITVERREVRDIEPSATHGLLICNPPYGQRLSDAASLPALFTELGDALRARFDGWRASVLAPDAALGFRTGLRLTKKNAARNGAIDVVLLTFDVSPGRTLKPRGEHTAAPHGNPGAPDARLDPHLDPHSRRLPQSHPQEPQAPRALGTRPGNHLLPRL